MEPPAPQPSASQPQDPQPSAPQSQDPQPSSSQPPDPQPPAPQSKGSDHLMWLGLLVSGAILLSALPQPLSPSPINAPAPQHLSTLPQYNKSDPAAHQPQHPCSATDRQGNCRIAVIPDIHGDYEALLKTLELAEDADEIICTGDVVDRGPHSFESYQLLDQLSGIGNATLLIGNHEVMNFAGYAGRYIHPHEFHEYAEKLGIEDKNLARLGAFNTAEGLIGQQIADHYKVAYAIHQGQPGTLMPLSSAATVFVHAGIIPELAQQFPTVDALNAFAENQIRSNRGSIRDWQFSMKQDGEFWVGESSPFWSREFALQNSEKTCQRLQQTLEIYGVARMIVGHTPQEDKVGVKCGGRLILGDVAMSRWMRGGGDVKGMALVLEVDPLGNLTRLEARYSDQAEPEVIYQANENPMEEDSPEGSETPDAIGEEANIVSEL